MASSMQMTPPSLDQQLEQLQTKMNHLTAEHKSLTELLRTQNLDLEQRKMEFLEFILLSDDRILRVKEKAEESQFDRRIARTHTTSHIKKLEKSVTLIIKSMEKIVTSLNQKLIPVLETFDGDLQENLEILKLSEDQKVALSIRLQQIFVKHEELKDLLEKVSDDEVITRSLNEAIKVKKTSLEREVTNLKQQLETLTSEFIALHADRARMSEIYAKVDPEIQEKLIKYRSEQFTD